MVGGGLYQQTWRTIVVQVLGTIVPECQDVFQTLKLLPAPWREAADSLTGQIAVHVVNIADPEDGPSAGIAFVNAMASAALGRPGFPMIEESSLQGHVRAVGGVAHEMVAAVHHQRRTTTIPAANAAALRDVTVDVVGKIDVANVELIEVVLQHASLPAGTA